MELNYIFGSITRDGVTIEALKTVGDRHAELEIGEFAQVRQEYPDSVITDQFRVLEHLRSAEADGLFYDWYAIDQHWRDTDRTAAFSDALQKATDAAGVVFVALAENGTIDAATAEAHKSLFPQWQAGVFCETGQYRNHQDQLYRCIQDHISQEGWEPEKAASLWTVAADPAEKWPAWRQPAGAHDAYAKGAQVSYNGKHWISTVDNNVQEPGVYGWTEF